MIFLLIGLWIFVFVCLASIVLPIRILAWLILMRLALLVPGRKAIGVGDLVRVTRRDHPFYGQVLKVRGDRGDRGYWLEREVTPRWSVGGEASAEDVIFVKRSWCIALPERGAK